MSRQQVVTGLTAEACGCFAAAVKKAGLLSGPGLKMMMINMYVKLNSIGSRWPVLTIDYVKLCVPMCIRMCVIGTCIIVGGFAYTICTVPGLGQGGQRSELFFKEGCRVGGSWLPTAHRLRAVANGR